MEALDADAAELVAPVRVDLAVKNRALGRVRPRLELHEHFAGDEALPVVVGPTPVRLRRDGGGGKNQSSGGEGSASRRPRDMSGLRHRSVLQASPGGGAQP